MSYHSSCTRCLKLQRGTIGLLSLFLIVATLSVAMVMLLEIKSFMSARYQKIRDVDRIATAASLALPFLQEAQKILQIDLDGRDLALEHDISSTQITIQDLGDQQNFKSLFGRAISIASSFRVDIGILVKPTAFILIDDLDLGCTQSVIDIHRAMIRFYDLLSTENAGAINVFRRELLSADGSDVAFIPMNILEPYNTQQLSIECDIGNIDFDNRMFHATSLEDRSTIIQNSNVVVDGFSLGQEVGSNVSDSFDHLEINNLVIFTSLTSSAGLALIEDFLNCNWLSQKIENVYMVAPLGDLCGTSSIASVNACNRRLVKWCYQNPRDLYDRILPTLTRNLEVIRVFR